MRIHHPNHSIVAMILLLTAGGLAGGCDSSDKPSDDPTSRALADPMHYEPRWTNDDYSVMHSSDKHALDRDLQHVFDP